MGSCHVQASRYKSYYTRNTGKFVQFKRKNAAFLYYKNLLTWLIRIYKGYQGVYPIKHGVY